MFTDIRSAYDTPPDPVVFKCTTAAPEFIVGSPVAPTTDPHDAPLQYATSFIASAWIDRTWHPVKLPAQWNAAPVVDPGPPRAPIIVSASQVPCDDAPPVRIPSAVVVALVLNST